MKTSLPALPAPPKPPRPEVKAPPKAAEPTVAVQPPKPEPNKAPEATEEVPRIPRQVKAFVPPPPSTRTPRLALATPILDAANPVLVGAPPPPTQLSAGAGMPVFSAGAAPPPSAPVAAAARDGNAKEDVAIVSLNPSDRVNTAVPNGDRPGEFSKAPALGPVASSSDGKSGLIIPGLEVREEPAKGVKPPDVAAPMRTIVYAELMRSVPVSTLSAPLRPGTRNIPRALEPRFQQRVVYTMVVPIEKMAIYGGDWILWFAERPDPSTPAPPGTPLMRAPLPLKKMELVDQTPAANRSSLRLMVAGTLEKGGKISGISLVSPAAAGVEQAVMRDVASWEFKPATRNGTPVDVDVVIEIPFNLPVTAAR